ncbi:MAG: sulfite exporter TauE/SafE family protein [Gemmatimonadetes bacterium]|nr:sulfite exporter TauE/SafE family protein [Gemmatimonadota bacterium]
MFIAALGFALVIGILLGMLGGGGSILTVPVLIYALGFDPKLAIAMSLPIVGFTSAIGAWRHWRAGNVDVRQALLFGIVAMTGAYAAGRASRGIDPRIQLAILGVAMTGAAISMLHSASNDAAARPAETKSSPWFLYGVGLAVGVLTGVVGVGGGFLIVPALVVLGGIPMRQAVGTSLMVIAMNCAAGFAGQAGHQPIDWRFVATFSVVATGGIVSGAMLLSYVKQQTLKRAFAVLLLMIAALILWQNRSLLGLS